MDHPLKRYRERHRLTQGQMGVLIGVTTASISRFESGDREPSFDTMRRILEVTGGEVTPNDFVAVSLRRQQQEGAAL